MTNEYFRTIIYGEMRVIINVTIFQKTFDLMQDTFVEIHSIKAITLTRSIHAKGEILSLLIHFLFH